MTVLKAENLNMVFGGLRAVADFSLELKSGELVGLIGPNGAGKTTVFNMLTGVYTPTSGQVLVRKASDGSLEKVSGLASNKITQKGVARTFQNIRLFKNLPVMDNVAIGFHSRETYPLVSSLFRLPPFHKREAEIRDRTLEMLDIFQIRHRADTLAGNLPYGEQRKLEIVRAMATKPQVLLLDEPAAGMNPQETKELMGLISFIREKFDLTILLIEHDMSLVMGICERLQVLDYGRTIAAGLPKEISKNPEVIKAYLGEEVHLHA